jgi:replicative DNA helicase
VASKEAAVLSAVIENKDIHVILGENPELFGHYGDGMEWVRQYYVRHKAIPSRELFETNFPDIELPKADAPSKYYLEQLKEEYVSNRMQDIMLKAAKAQGTLSAAEVLSKMQVSLAKLGQYTNSVRDLSMIDIDDAAEHFERVKDVTDANGGVPGISMGLDAIDSAYVTGMAPGHSIIFMGYTGRGKSMFSAYVAVQAWLQGYKVMIISLEMSPEEYRDRVYAMMSQGMFKISDLSRGDVDQDQFRTWAAKKFKNAADFIVVSNEGMANVTPNTIQAKIDTHRPELVVLDYLQLMQDNAKTQAMTPRMMNLSREVKLLATSNNIPIISITAVTDEDNDKRDGPPLLSQISWSSAIEYDANLVLAVHRHDDTNTVEVICRKIRNGDMFGVFYEVDFNSGVWVERFG